MKTIEGFFSKFSDEGRLLLSVFGQAVMLGLFLGKAKKYDSGLKLVADSFHISHRGSESQRKTPWSLFLRVRIKFFAFPQCLRVAYFPFAHRERGTITKTNHDHGLR